MATVVITFFLFVEFCVCKMDADSKAKRRDQIQSRRKSRWSMNSQRLEEIVAELMKPISDVKRSFDTDLSALLEEYLTEAGVHALEQAEAGGGPPPPAPNFAELAMLLQQSASIYGRKVDFLYQNVLLVSESLNNSTLEIEAVEEEETSPGGGGGGGGGGADSPAEGEGGTARRARARLRHHPAAFEHIELEGDQRARRSPSPPRPPPTLPRAYIELEPRTAAPGDAPLLDYTGEPAGLLAEFRATWRLRAGALVEGEGEGRAAPPIPLVELQAALAAAAPPDPPLPLPPPPRSSTPLEPPSTPPDTPLPPPPPPPPAPRDRKRRSDIHIDELVAGDFRILIGDVLKKKLRKCCEFSIGGDLIESVVGRRKAAILAIRRKLKLHALHPKLLDFRGFDVCSEMGGFRGWSAAEGSAAAAETAAAAIVVTAFAAAEESDDDGFFEQSSVESEGGDEWAARLARLAATAPPPPDVRALAAAVLAACPPVGTDASLRWPQLVAATARRPEHVSHVLLATLFLANAGNVSVEADAPLALDGFSLRLVSTDRRLYTALAAQEKALLASTTSPSSSTSR